MLTCSQDNKTRGFYAVYDGHGGVEAANFTSAHLHCHVVKQPEFKTDTQSALAKGFRAVDDAFIMKAKREVCCDLYKSCGKSYYCHHSLYGMGQSAVGFVICLDHLLHVCNALNPRS